MAEKAFDGRGDGELALLCWNWRPACGPAGEPDLRLLRGVKSGLP